MRLSRASSLFLVLFLALPLTMASAEITRTATSNTFCENNSCITNIYAGIINFYNGTDYEYINSTIIPSLNPLYDYEVTSGIYQAYFKANPTEAQIIKFIGNNTEITFQPMGLLYSNDLNQLQQIEMIDDVTGIPINNKMVYPNAYGQGINLTYRHNPILLKEELIINNFNNLVIPAQYILNGGNVTLNLDFIITTNANKIIVDGNIWDRRNKIITDNNISIYDDEDNLIYYLQKPIAKDSNNSETFLSYVLDKKGKSLYITIKTPYDWLSNSSRVYPISIDPTTYLIPYSFYDYYVNSNTGTVTGTALLRATDNNDVTPNYDNIAYGLIDTSSIPDDYVISSAILKFDANTYTASKGITKTFVTQLWDGSIYNNVVIDQTWTAGTNDVILGATQQGWITKTGISLFRVYVSDPPALKFRSMLINAYETSQATAIRLEVTHAPYIEPSPPIVSNSPIIPPPKKDQEYNLIFLALFPLMAIIAIKKRK